MTKTLQDYMKDVAPKSETQIVEDFNSKKYRASVATIIGILGIVLMLFISYNSDSIFEFNINTVDDFIIFKFVFWWFSLLERIICLILITFFANRLNRLPIIWQVFTFISPYLTLIIIGFTKKKDNKFYEFLTSKNKELFFQELDLSSKLKLYNHILAKNRYSFGYKWYKALSMFNDFLFYDENNALITLQEYERLFNNNMLKELRSNMPHFKDDKEKFFYSLVKIGLIDKGFYKDENNDTNNE